MAEKDLAEELISFSNKKDEERSKDKPKKDLKLIEEDNGETLEDLLKDIQEDDNLEDVLKEIERQKSQVPSRVKFTVGASNVSLNTDHGAPIQDLEEDLERETPAPEKDDEDKDDDELYKMIEASADAKYSTAREDMGSLKQYKVISEDSDVFEAQKRMYMQSWEKDDDKFTEDKLKRKVFAETQTFEQKYEKNRKYKEHNPNMFK